MVEKFFFEYDRNLLIIDDEVEITKSLFRQFRRKYNVHVATSAIDALPIMEKEHIQVVLSDQRMPGMTGVDFFTKIKEKYPDALKLILTGYSDIEAVIGAINEGQVFRYLTKPWNPLELNLVIEEAFEKHELITKNRMLLSKLQEANANLERKIEERTQELKNANINLTKLNIEKNKYIGIVAHDLRSPIGGALSFATLLTSNYSDFSQTDKLSFLKIINERCSFALNLIEDLLDVSKIESGILNIEAKDNEYCKLVKACISQNSLFAKNKSQEILLNCPGEEVVLPFDKNKIEQVLDNLISNAIKYSHSDKKIWVDVQIKNNCLITQVKDEGQGIPKDELNKVFSAYETTSAKPTGNEKATGLGLAIAKKIVEAHNGTINVESTLNVGSEFTFSLPLN